MAPAFTWSLSSSSAGDRQAGFLLEVDQVTSHKTFLPVWRTGLIDLQIGDQVQYAGDPLQSRQSYRWRVQALDRCGQSGEWSDWARFEMGVMSPDKISANWIAGGAAIRHDFIIGASVQRARAYVSGLGYYEFYCNGRKVSCATLAPSHTDYRKRVEYETIDLGNDLVAGANAVGFLLGDGFWRDGENAMSRELTAIAEIVLELEDGSRNIIATGDHWKAADSPVCSLPASSTQQLFDGVAVDFRSLPSVWTTDIAEWREASISNAPVGPLVPALVPPVRVVDVVTPQSVKRSSPNLLSIDMGQNLTGYVTARVEGHSGDMVTVRHAELTFPDGRLDPRTLRSAKQTDRYVLSGSGDAIEPKFTYHGFRYAEIEGDIDKLSITNIAAAAVRSDLEAVGSISTSDPKVNWLLDALKRTVASNAMGIMTDVCQRDERRGWLMDGFTGLKAGMLFFDMNAIGRKWIQDMVDIQQPDGSLLGDSAPVWFPSCSVAWQRTVVLAPAMLYEIYGDRAILERSYHAMVRYADYLLANLRGDLFPEELSKHPPEWLSIGRRNNGIATAGMIIGVLRAMSRASDVVGAGNDGRFDDAAERMAAAAHRAWYDPRSGCYLGGDDFAQANQVYALHFGITPPEDREAVFERLVDDLMVARGEGPFVTTGIGSTEYLPLVLSDFGRDDIVWQWLQRDAYPGYGFMRANGATAIWERWEKMNYRQMNAHNHTGLTGIGVWLRRHLVGIDVVPGPEPVFELRPGIHLPLESLRCDWKSKWGSVRVEWSTEGDSKRLIVNLPPGCAGRLQRNGYSDTKLAAGRSEFLVEQPTRAN